MQEVLVNKPSMMSYIEEEKEVLTRILTSFRRSKKPVKTKELLILATGSSLNAALAAQYFLQDNLRALVRVCEPYSFLKYDKLGRADLVLAISQSGKSASTLKAFTSIKSSKKVKKIALTEDEGLELAKSADLFLPLKAGEEKVGFVTKGFSATLLNLMLFALGNNKNLPRAKLEKHLYGLQAAIDNIPKVIDEALAFVRCHENELKNAQSFSFIGSGALFGIAKEAETKFRETVRRPSTGYELEAYMHGPYLEANKDHVLIFLDQSPRAEDLYKYMSRYARCLKLNMLPEARGLAKPLLAAAFIQVLSAKTARLCGVDLTMKIMSDFDQVVKSKV